MAISSERKLLIITTLLFSSLFLLVIISLCRDSLIQYATSFTSRYSIHIIAVLSMLGSMATNLVSAKFKQKQRWASEAS